MRRFAKVMVAGLLLASVSVSVAMADYDKGFKYYKKYIMKKSNIKGSDLVKMLGVKTPEEVKALLKDNAKPLIKKLEKLGKKEAIKGIKKIAKKKKLKDLEDFLVGIVNGKIPAG